MLWTWQWMNRYAWKSWQSVQLRKRGTSLSESCLTVMSSRGYQLKTPRMWWFSIISRNTRIRHRKHSCEPCKRSSFKTLGCLSVWIQLLSSLHTWGVLTKKTHRLRRSIKVNKHKEMLLSPTTQEVWVLHLTNIKRMTSVIEGSPPLWVSSMQNSTKRKPSK